jgi:hypothetical protein
MPVTEDGVNPQPSGWSSRLLRKSQWHTQKSKFG